MAIPTALLAKVLGGLGVLATAATVISVTTRNTQEEPKAPTPEDPLKVLNEKIKALGIEGCEFTEGETKKENCTLDKEKIGKVKFEGKAEDALVSEGASLSLTIEKGYEDFKKPETPNNLYFPEGLRFIFKNTNSSDVTIGNSGSEIKLLKNTTYDYKIKTEGENKTLAKAIDLSNSTDLSDLLNKVGLSCKSDTAEECGFGISNVNIWKGRNSYKTRGSDPTSTEKIKVSKDTSGYRQGIKFYVDKETNLKTSDTPPKDYPLNKETSYEIDIKDIEEVLGSEKQIVKKWFLVDKSTTKLNEKIQALGITDCVLGEGEISKTCTLDKGKIEKIKFDGKSGDSLTPENSSLTLTIERDHLGSEFPRGLRFTFTNSSDNEVTIGSSSSQITLKPGVNYDYKIKDDTKLEKAWTLETLGAKVGLTCQTGDNENECTLKTEGINAWRDGTHYITNGKISESDKKMTVEKDQKDYLEGFKFTVKGEGDITLSGGTKKTGNDGISKLTKTDKAYGIDVKDIGGTKTWFLVEKSTPQESQ